MKKFLKLTSVLAFIVLIVFVLIRIPAIQDRIAPLAMVALLSPADLPEEDSLSALVCGSASPLGATDRAQTCIMVRAGDEIYIVDIGDGANRNLGRWRIPMNKVQAVLLTHLHSDHISDLADLHLATWIPNRKSQLKVYGPQGVEFVTRGFEEAYQSDYFFRNEHHGDEVAPLHSVGFEPITIDLNEPIIIEKDGLKVSAFEVPHDPVKPALAFRFDYKGRSIVISGDTIYSENLISYSKDADVLFHEALSMNIVSMMEDFTKRSGNDLLSKILFDVQDYHTDPVDAAKAANEAGVKHLIFYHLAPAPAIWLVEDMFVRGVNSIRDDWTLSDDGTMVVLPVNSEEIKISTID
tara:strand:+ start:3335 stop:4390 length:1056 start_codon:yes stop_codon:yes gene_type:complete